MPNLSILPQIPLTSGRQAVLVKELQTEIATDERG